MIPISPMQLEAFRYSHVKAASLTVLSGSKVVDAQAEPLGISSGSITADRYQKARRTLECVIPLSQWQDAGQRWPWEPKIPIDVLQTRIRVEIGYDLGSPARVETFAVGMFRVNELGRTSSGELSISGTSLESYVIDNELLDESEYPKVGDKCIDSIKKLITACFPASDPPKFDVTPGAAAMAGVALTDPLSPGKRWELIESYAFVIDCDVYCAPNGDFRIAKTPDVKTGKPVWRINEGADGVLVSMSTNVSRDSAYNAVRVITQSSDADQPPVSGDLITVKNLGLDPKDDAEILRLMDWDTGLFGKKPYLHTYNGESKGFTKADCNNLAKTMLQEMLAEERTLDLNAIPNPALEPDDIVQILTIDPINSAPVTEKHMLTTMTIPLGLGEWSAGTLSNRTSEKLNDESPLKPPTE